MHAYLKSYNLKTACLIITVLYLLWSGSVFAQNPADKVIENLRKEVELRPDLLSAHSAFIAKSGLKDSTLVLQYERWIKKFPTVSAVPFAVGKELELRGRPEAKKFLMQAVDLDPKLHEAWFLLFKCAKREWNYSEAQNYINKARLLEVDNPEYAYQYLLSFNDLDTPLPDLLSLRFVQRFPGTEQSAHILYSLSEQSKFETEKEIYYRLLYSQFIGSNYIYRMLGISRYYRILLAKEPEKAFELALNMSLEKDKNNVYIWNKKVVEAKKFMYAKSFLQSNKPDEALDILNRVDLSKPYSGDYIDAEETLAVLKAEALDATSKADSAYEVLLDIYSKKPSYQLRAKLLSIAERTNKDSSDVFTDVKDRRYQTSSLSAPITFKSYLTGDSLKLSDYTGRIALLTYWFPSCGPCRTEFPHLQSVISKFKESDIAYVGVNGIEKEDPKVLPFMEKHKFSFNPVKEVEGNDRDTMRVIGYPTNFLIDQNGQVVFSNFKIYDKKGEEMLELMIAELLERTEETPIGGLIKY